MVLGTDSAILNGLCHSAQGCDPALSDNPSPLIQPKWSQCATAVLIPLPRKSGGATLGCCRRDFQPQRGCVKFPPPSRNPAGVVCLWSTLPLCRNPFGI